MKFGELTKDVLVPRALPPPPPVPPKAVRANAALREIENQIQPSAPVLFTEFKYEENPIEFIVSSLIFSAQALIAPFPSFDFSLLDGCGDDQAIENLQEHLRRRVDERHRLNMVKFSSISLSLFITLSLI